MQHFFRSASSSLTLQRPLHRVHTRFRDRIFYWVERSVFDQASLETEDVLHYGVPEKIVMADLQGQIAEEGALKSLPSAFLLVLLYTCTLINTSSISDIWALQHAINFDITENANFAFSENYGHKSLHDVNTYTDFSSWLELGFKPLFLSKDRPRREGSTLPPETMMPEEFDMYLSYTRKVGPVKLAQMVAMPQECRRQGLAEAYGLKSCAAHHDNHFVEATANELLQRSFVEEPSRTIWLANLGADGHFATRQLTNFSASEWLMRDTVRARLTFMVYSPELDMLLLSNVEFMFPRTGHIWKDITHRALPLCLFETWSSFFFEVLFYILITSLLLTELYEIVSLARKMQKCGSDWRGFLGRYLNVWNGVDWCCIVLAYILLGFQIYKASLTSELQQSLEAYPRTVRSCYQESQAELCADRAGEDLLQHVEFLGILARNCRLLRGIYPAIVILRMLKAFSAQPRLAVLTRTLSAAAVDLFHFGLVFLSIFAAFAVMGTAFFGEDEVKFSTLDRAASVLFFALMGEVQWTSIDSLGRPVALLFFGAFQFVGLLLMLNMLIAIMMDIYACTKSCATRSEPLWTSLWEVAVRNWEVFKGREVSLHKLLKMMEKQKGPQIFESEEIVTAQDLMKWGIGLKSDQAERILVHALVNYRRQQEEPVGMEEVLHAANETLANVAALSELLERVDQHTTCNQGCQRESAQPVAHRQCRACQDFSDVLPEGRRGSTPTASHFAMNIGANIATYREQSMESPHPLPTLLTTERERRLPRGAGSQKAHDDTGLLRM